MLKIMFEYNHYSWVYTSTENRSAYFQCQNFEVLLGLLNDLRLSWSYVEEYCLLKVIPLVSLKFCVQLLKDKIPSRILSSIHSTLPSSSSGEQTFHQSEDESSMVHKPFQRIEGKLQVFIILSIAKLKFKFLWTWCHTLLSVMPRNIHSISSNLSSFC